MYNFMPETCGSHQTKVVRSRLLLLMIREFPELTRRQSNFQNTQPRLPGIVKRQLGHSFQNISTQSCSLVVVIYIASAKLRGCLPAGRKGHWTGHLV